MSRKIKKSVNPIMIDTRLSYVCVNCKHVWRNRSDKDFEVPNICPKCKSRNWAGDFKITPAALKHREVQRAYDQLAARNLQADGERSTPDNIKAYLDEKMEK